MADSGPTGSADVSRRTLLKAGLGAVGVTGAMETTALAYDPDDKPAAEVTIKRDGYGIPHIYARDADSKAPTFFGFGYATGRDRLYQLELYRRYYYGTVSEVLGEEWLDFDRAARKSHAAHISLDEQLDQWLGEEHYAVLEAFADGINRYIADVREGDRQFHKGFVDNDFEPDAWTPKDVAGCFVASMAFFSGFQLETLGAAALSGLQAQYDDATAYDLFEDLLPGDDPGAPTSSVQPDVGYTPPYTPASGPNEGGGDAQAALDPVERGPTGEQNTPRNEVEGGEFAIPTDPKAVHEAEMDRMRTLAVGLEELGLAIKYGSNALAVQGDVTESGDALLYGGPQMEFSTPSVMYGAGLHGPDFDVVGNTVAGYPFIMFGRNRNGAMTSTAGIDNSIQTFVEHVRTREGKPDQYEFQGEWHDIEATTHTIPVKGGEDVEMTLRRTRHGVVTQWNPEEGQAIAQTRGYDGRDMNSWKAFYDCQFAGDVEEFSESARQCDYALNFLWADKNGDIGYFHLGRYPNANKVPWDTRLPADGTKFELDDDDFLRAADGGVPYSINPPAGYAANWNNKPAPHWNNGDLSYSWGTDHRVQRIINDVEHYLDENGAVTYENLKDVVYDIAFVDKDAIRYKDLLLDALDGASLSDTEKRARAELASWRNYRQGTGERYGGTYPAGYTIWNRVMPKIETKTFAPTFGDAYPLASYFLTYHYGKGTLMRALHPDEARLDLATDYFDGDRDGVLRAAFSEAVSELDSEYDGDPSTWQAPVRIDELDNMALFGLPIGVGDAGDMPWMNRGTENHFVRLSDDPEGEIILPPGNSGYIAPDGTKSPHYDDQLELFRTFEYLPLRFTDDEVASATESTRTFEPGSPSMASPTPSPSPSEGDGGAESPTESPGGGTTESSAPGFGAVGATLALGSVVAGAMAKRMGEDEE